MPQAVRYWLMKSEPSSFSIGDLQRSPRQTTCWDGVRNYQARNYLRAMKVGDGVLFYHSSTDPPSVAGIAKVVRTAYPDPTAWDMKDKHYDPKSSRSNPIWDMVDIRLVQRFARPIPLADLRKHPGLKHMELLRKGSRLSVQPVRPDEWKLLLKLSAK